MEAAVKAWQYALDRLDKQIEVELNLISARISWLVISESFLFNAFVASGGEGIRPPGVGLGIQATMLVVGYLIALHVNAAVQAALGVIEERKAQREPIERRLEALLVADVPGISLPSVSARARWNVEGNRPARYIPTGIKLGWVALGVVLVCRAAWLYSTGAFHS